MSLQRIFGVKSAISPNANRAGVSSDPVFLQSTSTDLQNGNKQQQQTLLGLKNLWGNFQILIEFIVLDALPWILFNPFAIFFQKLRNPPFYAGYRPEKLLSLAQDSQTPKKEFYLSTWSPPLDHISRKFCSSFLPSPVRIDSGWNCTPWIGKSRCLSPMISPSSVSAMISRQSGRVSRFTMRE